MFKESKVLIILVSFLVLFTGLFPKDAFAITAEERLIDVERQLKAIADEIRKYEGDKTDLEQQILENDQALKEVNIELALVQQKLLQAEKTLDIALQGYDESLDGLTEVQSVILDEQSKLGKVQIEISNVTSEPP